MPALLRSPSHSPSHPSSTKMLRSARSIPALRASAFQQRTLASSTLFSRAWEKEKLPTIKAELKTRGLSTCVPTLPTIRAISCVASSKPASISGRKEAELGGADSLVLCVYPAPATSRPSSRASSRPRPHLRPPLLARPRRSRLRSLRSPRRRSSPLRRSRFRLHRRPKSLRRPR